MNAAILLAAGRGTRMGAAAPDKVFAELAGAPVLVWALRAFDRAESIGRIVVATRAERLDQVLALGPPPARQRSRGQPRRPPPRPPAPAGKERGGGRRGAGGAASPPPRPPPQHQNNHRRRPRHR